MFGTDVVREFEVEGHGKWRIRGNGSYWAIDQQQPDGSSWKEYLEQEPPPGPVFEEYNKQCIEGTMAELGVDLATAQEMYANEPTEQEIASVNAGVAVARIMQEIGMQADAPPTEPNPPAEG